MCAKPADRLGDELRHEGHRFSHQRQVIFEEMQKQRCHPDAREIYDVVRQRLPRISLGTVYRGLEVLVKLRLIRKVKHEDTSRFDANLSDHYHLICSCCNQIFDVDTSVLTGLNTQGLDLGNTYHSTYGKLISLNWCDEGVSMDFELYFTKCNAQ